MSAPIALIDCNNYYGPTVPGGRVPMRFGPLGMDGGERRLNVLISRAKQRCEVFASMSDEDIDPDFAGTRKGVLAFKLFLHFARMQAAARAVGFKSTSGQLRDLLADVIAAAIKGELLARQSGMLVLGSSEAKS